MIYILEGLPGGGKTSIINSIRLKCNVSVVNQIIYHDNYQDDSINYYFYSDLMKYREARDLLENGRRVVMDRGYISSLAYNYSFDRFFNEKRYSRAKRIYHDFDAAFNAEAKYLLIDLSVDDSMKRKGGGENNDYIWRNERFLSFMKEFYDKEVTNIINTENIIRINGKQPLSNIYRKVEEIVCK